METINIWESILFEIQKNLNKESFTTWFKPIKFLKYEDSSVYLSAPDQVFVDWISNNYQETLEEAIEKITGSTTHIVFSISLGSAPPLNSKQDSNKQLTALTFKPANIYNLRNIKDFPLSSNNNSYVDVDPFELPLNSKYTFETFVVGSCNQFAHAAALAVAATPFKAYNPLFIYGGVGLGKTHLMCAIGHRIKQINQHLQLSYISAERFMNDLINAIRYDKTLTFREKYRSIDILLIDDIQFIAGKERTQEEFFHTFNALYDNQKQIVISSDCPPREIPTLEERLHSRFEWGLIADIQPPDLETKVAILRRKAEIDNINLPDNVALFIAGKIRSNVRELEGSLIRLTALSSLKGEPISLSLAEDALRNIIEEEKGITIEAIQRVVAESFNMRVSDLKSKSNARSIAVPRQIAMYLCKLLTKASLPEIGREFSGKHHTTVLHSINKISKLYEQKGDFHRLINNLITRCK
jgi:chromosomal replication initiator protein